MSRFLPFQNKVLAFRNEIGFQLYQIFWYLNFLCIEPTTLTFVLIGGWGGGCIINTSCKEKYDYDTSYHQKSVIRVKNNLKTTH